MMKEGCWCCCRKMKEGVWQERRSSRSRWGEGMANPEVGSRWSASGTLAEVTRRESASGWRRQSEGRTSGSWRMLASGSTCSVVGKLLGLMGEV